MNIEIELDATALAVLMQIIEKNFNGDEVKGEAA